MERGSGTDSQEIREQFSSQSARETYQDWSEDFQAQQIRHVSNGRGYDRQEIVCRDIVSD